ncbi:MAG: L-serine ammonia-lyase, iron-sulfur-dependent, subunit alpha [Vallitaleaceae bacterium]|jgi:L-serine dehydratase|nr:L-serine ammonia-lyase, iron-sulfur-dependent, subunit alpha [Vallitaleaceae bacterium]
MLKFDEFQKIIILAKENNCRISELIIEDQIHALEISEEALIDRMTNNYMVMKDAIMTGSNTSEKSTSGLIGGDAVRMKTYADLGKSICGENLSNAIASALAVAEVNACMGRIVAAPTAGACGIMPAALWSVQQSLKLSDEAVVRAMFTASSLGMVIATAATLAGAQGGCQAECGSATAMATVALIELMGGSPNQIGHGAAIALKSVLGLVCDPVAGLVEVPCIKRNAIGVAQVFAATDMALAGIESVIPIDEVISAMKAIGDEMPTSLKETSESGLADTKTGRRIERDLM